MVPTYFLLDMNIVCWYVLAQQLTHCYVNLWLLLWTRHDRERFYVSSVIVVIKTELCQLHRVSNLDTDLKGTQPSG